MRVDSWTHVSVPAPVFRGTTLLEFLVASMLFLAVILWGYEAIDFERVLVSGMLARTRPDEESAYRMQLLRTFFNGTAAGFRVNPLLAEAPRIFPDLNFGEDPRTDAFSLALPAGKIAPFRREGLFLRVPAGTGAKKDALLLLAGAVEDGRYAWNYAKVNSIVSNSVEDEIYVEFKIADAGLTCGVLVPVAMHGFLYSSSTLHWISPAGQSSPFFDPLERFEFAIRGERIDITWQAGPAQTTFEVHP